MILVVPKATPVIIPVAEPAVAIEVLPLVHVPPEGVDDSVVLLPIHVLPVPVIDVGNGSTVNTLVVVQPVLNI